MDLPSEFIERAMMYRRNILQQKKIEESTSSSWNRDIIRKSCELCHKTIGLEVHHIQARATAVQQRLSNGIHMNDKSNLIVICQACHDSVHAGKLEIQEMTITSDGPERVFKDKEKEKEKEKKSKWSDEDQEIIQMTLKKYFSLSLKSIRAHLESKHDIRISETKLGEFRKQL